MTATLSDASSLGPAEGKYQKSARWDQLCLKLASVRGCPVRARLGPSSGPTHGSGLLEVVLLEKESRSLRNEVDLPSIQCLATQSKVPALLA